MTRLTKEEIEFLKKYYAEKIERHSKILAGYKYALKDIEDKDDCT